MNKKMELIKAAILLPGSVLVLIPAFILLITRSYNILFGWQYPRVWIPLLAGIFFLSVGALVSFKTVLLFLKAGDGTPAPWAPPRNFVVSGPYRFVRNPMILSVLSVLLGEFFLLGSFPILIWCLVFWAINMFYFIYVEEPGLEKRFGEEYLEYKRNVPRWIPRLKPWKQN